jgi:Tfp pilus assembly protein FimT
MKIMRQISLAVLVVGILALFVTPSFAQIQRTVTITATEDDINNSFRVTNPARLSISNKSVDLQSGQVVITATYTPRRGTSNNSYTIATTLVPSVSNGRVTWTATSVVVNGTGVSNQQINQANSLIASAWRTLSQGYTGRHQVTALTITETDITYTVIRGA